MQEEIDPQEDANNLRRSREKQTMKEELDVSDLDNTRKNNKVFFGQLVFENDRKAAQFRAFIAVMTVLFLSLCMFPAIVIAVLIQATKVCGQ